MKATNNINDAISPATNKPLFCLIFFVDGIDPYSRQDRAPVFPIDNVRSSL